MSFLPGRLAEYYLPKGGGDVLQASPAGDIATLKLRAAESEGRVSFLEYETAPGAIGPIPHSHIGHEEIFYVLSGTLHMLVGDDIIECTPGDFAHAPRHARHTFWNQGIEPARFLAVFTPAGFEDIFAYFDEAIREGRVIDREEEAEIARRFDMTLHDWPGEVPANFR